ncbi:unnamed protein product [Ixodes pacificus]
MFRPFGIFRRDIYKKAILHPCHQSSPPTPKEIFSVHHCGDRSKNRQCTALQRSSPSYSPLPSLTAWISHKDGMLVEVPPRHTPLLHQDPKPLPREKRRAPSIIRAWTLSTMAGFKDGPQCLPVSLYRS